MLHKWSLLTRTAKKLSSLRGVAFPAWRTTPENHWKIPDRNRFLETFLKFTTHPIEPPDTVGQVHQPPEKFTTRDLAQICPFWWRIFFPRVKNKVQHLCAVQHRKKKPPGDVDLLCRMFVPSSPLRGCKNPINIGGGVACVTNYDHGGPLIKQPITPPPSLGKKLKVRELQPWHFWRVMEFGNANNITFP